MPPEAQARLPIDQLFALAGWLVHDHKPLNLGAGLGVAVHEYPTATAPADDVLFAARQPVGDVEARKCPSFKPRHPAQKCHGLRHFRRLRATGRREIESQHVFQTHLEFVQPRLHKWHLRRNHNEVPGKLSPEQVRLGRWDGQSRLIERTRRWGATSTRRDRS